ncbi:zinc-binding protein A33-like [Seriola lalandi dorsalis]|uniref:Zinc-binding protein A33-like n=1 Tax=Seriola lalandi dorsalis TaxID=1841481 RepID=A0A3B4Y9V4_SERLL|nr:zinc-binding protein A33-like [Seriola lalandi dorsalis]
MASTSYTEDLTCSICLTIFTDPVMLPCGHSFCRECISLSLSKLCQCPHCRAAVPKEGKCLLTNHILKSLAEKEAEKLRGKHRDEEVDDRLCPEHEEKLKLFCITDQQLACIICRDGEKHEGHKFKPIKEAAASVRRELETFVEQVSDDICAVESIGSKQREEITKTKEKSQQLMTQICRQFEEMHQFLRKREDEIKKDLKDKEEEAMEKMSETLNAMETALSENRELEGKVTSVLKITDYERFLKSWTEENSMKTAKRSFKPRGGNLKVVNPPLSLGPHESHLQFFMWQEMLQVIQPRAEELSLKSDSKNITVSEDGRNLMYSPNIVKSQQNSGYGELNSGYHSCHYCGRSNRHSCPSYTEDTSVRYASAYSTNQFTSGQHYWEIEVGKRDYWKVGLQKYYLSYNEQKYVTSSQNKVTNLTFTGRPQKIGIYLDCMSKELSFYDAENMTHIHTMREGCLSVPVKAYFEYKFSKGADHNPLRVCLF